MSQEISDVRRSVDVLTEKVNAQAKKKKDAWDKVQAVAGLATGVLVALIGAFATYLYNDRQRRSEEAQRSRELSALEAQTVASFMPHLNSADPREKETALLSIGALANPGLAVRLADLYRDEGSVGALSRLASGSDAEAAQAAAQSLGALLEVLRRSVVNILDANEQAFGTGFVYTADGLVLTTDYVAAERPESARTTDGELHECETLAVRPESGISVLRLHASTLPPLALEEGEVDIGALRDLVFLGFTRSGWTTSSGAVEGLHSREKVGPKIGVQDPLLTTTMQTQQGQGGAPVLNRAGRVVGIVYSMRADQPGGTGPAYLLSVETIRKGLAALGPLGSQRVEADTGSSRK